MRLAQQRASNPASSAWVSANAGSGKTHVLVQRVLRLLLDGAPPSGDSLPHLHQGGGRQHGGARLQDAGEMDEPRRRRAHAGDRQLRRAGARRRPARLRAPPVRAHDRDAGRPEDPDDPRLLRAPAASLSLRGQCRGRISRRRGARSGAADGGGARARFRRSRSIRPSATPRSRESRWTPAPKASTICSRRRSGGAAKSPALGDRAAYGAALRRKLGLGPERDERLDQTRNDARQAAMGGMGAPNSRKAAPTTRASPRVSFAPPARAIGDECLAAYLEAFFTDKGEGKPRGGETRGLVTKTLAKRLPDLPQRLSDEQDRLVGAARSAARRRGGRAQPRARRRRASRPRRIRRAQRRPRSARFRRPDRSARFSCSTAPTRPGCSTSSTPASITFWSTRRRTPPSRNGRF